MATSITIAATINPISTNAFTISTTNVANKPTATSFTTAITLRTSSNSTAAYAISNPTGTTKPLHQDTTLNLLLLQSNISTSLTTNECISSNFISN